MSTSIASQTVILTLARVSIFLGCRKYLLRTIYSDLRSLSIDATPGTPVPARKPDSPINLSTLNFEGQGDDTELDSLPLPSTHTPKSPKFYTEDAKYFHASISRIIFSWCFAESCMMFALLMLQGLGIMSASTRLLNWRISLFTLMFAILVAIPLSASWLLAVRTTDDTVSIKPFLGPRAFLSLIPVALYLFALSYIPLPASLETSDLTTTALSRLIVVGTIVLGLLSGFGAISSSWQFLPLLSRNKIVPSEQDIDTAQYALNSVRNDLMQRRLEAARREGSSPQATWFSRVGSTFRGSDSLTLEIRGLEALEYQMSRNLEVLRERCEAAKFSNTFRGRIFNFIGRIFMVYCVIRVISSVYNVIFLPTRRSSSATYPDLVAELFAYLIARFSSAQIRTEDIASFTRQLSLLLVGIIILSSIRLVLRGATRALHITSRNLAASLMLLVLAQIMGIYMLSTLVQLRSSFPPPLSAPSDVPSGTPPAEENLFSTIPAYEVFGSLFDWSFLIAAGASLFVRWGVERVNGAGDEE